MTGTRRPPNRREMIVEAAGGLFSEHGYGGVGIDDIGAAVGITGPAIYSHFSGKGDLLAAVIERALDAIDEVLQEALASSDSPREVLSRFVAGTIDVTLSQRYVAGLYVRERQNLSEEDARRLERKRRAIFRTEVELLGQLRPDLDPDRVQLRLFAIVSGMLGAIGEFPTKLDQAELSQELHRIALAALLVQ